MAQPTVLRHPDVAQAGAHRRQSDTGWSPRGKLACFLRYAAASWALVLAPFLLID